MLVFGLIIDCVAWRNTACQLSPLVSSRCGRHTGQHWINNWSCLVTVALALMGLPNAANTVSQLQAAAKCLRTEPRVTVRRNHLCSSLCVPFPSDCVTRVTRPKERRASSVAA